MQDMIDAYPFLKLLEEEDQREPEAFAIYTYPDALFCQCESVLNETG